MNCTTLETIAKGCNGNQGGISIALVNDMENIDSVTIDEPNWIVTAITQSTAPFVPFEFRRNTSSYVEDTQVDLVNGSTFVNATVNLMFHRRDAAKSRSIKIMGEGQRDLAVIVKDLNNKYWWIPNAQLTATGEGSGQAKADGSKYSVTLLAEAEALAYEVDESIISGLLTI